MDTTTEIMMMILEDLGNSEGSKLNGKYARYYESLDEGQSRTVVSTAINRILNENPSASCDFGEETFTLRI